MDWPSGLGGVGGRGRASTHGAFSWVDGCKSFFFLNPTKKLILSFFGAGRGGSLVGGDRGGSWGGGGGGSQPSTHENAPPLSPRPHDPPPNSLLCRPRRGTPPSRPQKNRPGQRVAQLLQRLPLRCSARSQALGIPDGIAGRGHCEKRPTSLRCFHFAQTTLLQNLSKL